MSPSSNFDAQKKFEELKTQIKGLDKALQMIYNEKLSKKDLEQVKASL